MERWGHSDLSRRTLYNYRFERGMVIPRDCRPGSPTVFGLAVGMRRRPGGQIQRRCSSIQGMWSLVLLCREVHINGYIAELDCQQPQAKALNVGTAQSVNLHSYDQSLVN